LAPPIREGDRAGDREDETRPAQTETDRTLSQLSPPIGPFVLTSIELAQRVAEIIAHILDLELECLLR
jgi:hypothetical protein